MKKQFSVKDPLYWGVIWYKKFLSDNQKKKEGLKKFRFKRINKAKKYHRYKCNFWNNECELMITKEDVIFDCYNIDGDMMNYSLRFNLGTRFSYEEIKWFVETMQKIHNAISKKEKNISIDKIGYELIKTYQNYAFEFERKDEIETTNIVFWDDEDGGVIELAHGYNEDFKEDIEITFEEGDVYFPIINKHLSVPICLMKEILNEMEKIV